MKDRINYFMIKKQKKILNLIKIFDNSKYFEIDYFQIKKNNY